MAKVQIKTFKLNNGREIPALGYGTWVGLDDKLDFLTDDIPRMVDTLSYAIDIGYRHIDTAHLYRVEPEIGQILNKKFKEGVVKREDVFITTKVWNHYHREEDVEKSVRGSLRRLNLEYVDMALMHWPMAISEDGVDEKLDYLDTWRGFETVVKKGLAKSIGVSNFNVQQMKRLLENCQIPPACNQIQVNLNLSEKELVDCCQSHGVAVVGYTPFGSLFPGRGLADSPEPKVDNPTLVAVAKKHGKTATQVVLRYLYQRNIIVIPKTLTKSRVLENAQIFDFALDEKDVKELAKFDNGYRFFRPDFFQKYEHYPFSKVAGVEDEEIPLALLKWKNGVNGDIE